MAEQLTPAKAQRRRRSDADRSVQAILEAALDALAGDPMPAWPRSPAARVSCGRRSTRTSPPARRCSTPSWSTPSARSPTRRPPRSRHAASQRKRWTRPARDLAEARPVPRTARDQHGAALGRRAASPAPSGAESLRAVAREGQEADVFRRDVPVTWHLAVMRAIVHAASAELRSGRLTEATVEETMLVTVLAARFGPRRLDPADDRRCGRPWRRRPRDPQRSGRGPAGPARPR